MRRIDVDGDVHRAIERHRRGASESENDILRRILPLVPIASRAAAIGASPAPAGTRRRGQWTVEILGEKLAAANLKSAYRTLLQSLSERCPDFLDEFAGEKGRSRRYVARSPSLLYAASPHLAERHAEPLAPGWYSIPAFPPLRSRALLESPPGSAACATAATCASSKTCAESERSGRRLD